MTTTNHPSDGASKRWLGIVMVLVGATLWGLSGTASQRLFHHYDFTAGWLVDVRMGVSGLVLLAIVAIQRGPGKLVSVFWRHPPNVARSERVDGGTGTVLHVLFFSIVGLFAVQFSYLESIALGNAAMATFLQYLGPAFILLYATTVSRRLPTRWELISLVLAVLGTLLLVTNGEWGKIVVSTGAVIWGLVSAVTLAIYTVSPVSLIRQNGSAVVIGWGMLIGSVVSCIRTPPWRIGSEQFTPESIILTAFVVLLGTLLAFYLYLASTQYLTPTETGLIACMEPLSAAVAAVIWLHTHLGPGTVVGGVCILGTVAILATTSSRSRPKRHE